MLSYWNIFPLGWVQLLFWNLILSNTFYTLTNTDVEISVGFHQNAWIWPCSWFYTGIILSVIFAFPWVDGLYSFSVYWTCPWDSCFGNFCKFLSYVHKCAMHESPKITSYNESFSILDMHLVPITGILQGKHSEPEISTELYCTGCRRS